MGEKKIDPYLLLSQFVDYYVKSKMDTIKWINMERGLTDYKSSLKKLQSVAFLLGQVTNDPYAFISKRIEDFLKQYDVKEKKLGEEYIQILGWLKQNQIAEVTVKAAVEAALHDKRQSIGEMVKAANKLATDLMADCDIIGYAEGNAFLEALAQQKPTDVIAMFISHY